MSLNSARTFNSQLTGVSFVIYETLISIIYHITWILGHIHTAPVKESASRACNRTTLLGRSGSTDQDAIQDVSSKILKDVKNLRIISIHIALLTHYLQTYLVKVKIAETILNNYSLSIICC